VPGARVVFAEADPDHHRLERPCSAADAVVASAMAGARRRGAIVDMFAHGGHPRMGAADVIPFMPVRGVHHGPVHRCQDFGRALAETLDVPVYL
jgi:glutamate formiminotransferase